MKSRYILFRRAGVYYSEDTVTGKQHSLRTKDEAEALTILNAKNESLRQVDLEVKERFVYWCFSKNFHRGKIRAHI